MFQWWFILNYNANALNNRIVTALSSESSQNFGTSKTTRQFKLPAEHWQPLLRRTQEFFGAIRGRSSTAAPAGGI
jgi:hypothetical protein